MHSHMLYLTPRDSKHLFPGNTDKDFIVQFDRPLRLGFDCTLELLEFRCFLDHPSRNTVYVLCDLCDNSTVNGSQAPVLRSLCMNGSKRRNDVEFANPYQIACTTPSARNCSVLKRGESRAPDIRGRGARANGPRTIPCQRHLRLVMTSGDATSIA